jgi:hypothetical protein
MIARRRYKTQVYKELQFKIFMRIQDKVDLKLEYPLQHK